MYCIPKGVGGRAGESKRAKAGVDARMNYPETHIYLKQGH